MKRRGRPGGEKIFQSVAGALVQLEGPEHCVMHTQRFLLTRFISTWNRAVAKIIHKQPMRVTDPPWGEARELCSTLGAWPWGTRKKDSNLL